MLTTCTIMMAIGHSQVTFCVRTMPMSYTNPVDAAFAYSLYFGTLLPVNIIIKSPEFVIHSPHPYKWRSKEDPTIVEVLAQRDSKLLVSLWEPQHNWDPLRCLKSQEIPKNLSQDANETYMLLWHAPKNPWDKQKHPYSDMALHHDIFHYHQDWTDIDEGWLYGEWESGPWHGFHTKEKAFGAYGWVCQISW